MMVDPGNYTTRGDVNARGHRTPVMHPTSATDGGVLVLSWLS